VGRPPAGRSGAEAEKLAARARAWAERSCLDQGVPVRLSEPQAVARVAELLAQARQTGVSRVSSKRL
jgi:hypothetical protein